MIDLVSTQSVVDSTGRRITGSVTITLRPGVGVVGPTGEHLEGGPHTVPVAFAVPLVSSHRAAYSEPVATAPTEPDPAAQVKGAPGGVQQRDPVATTREGRGRR
jgi:hypothetical protein